MTNLSSRRLFAAMAILAGMLAAGPATTHPARAQGAAAPAPSAADTAAMHPAEDYKRAVALFKAGDKDEATYWFYRGQFRYRLHLAARPDLPADGDKALFGSLSEVVGRPINEWAFGDLPRLVKTLDRVIAWAKTENDPFTPRHVFPKAYAQVTTGLEALRKQILESGDSIRAQRKANGLENRT